MLKTALCAAVALAAFAGTAAAQYPDRHLNFVVPFPPGGASNFIGRAIAAEMGADLGQEIVVLNRDGAGGTVGAAELARANPDGYTIGILTSTPLLMRPHTTNVPYDLSSFELVCRAFDNPLILTVSVDSPFETFEDLVEEARAAPGAVKFYSEGPGSLQDIAMSQLQEAGEFTAIGVPMAGHSAAVQNLLAGVIEVAPLTAGEVLGNPDMLRAIAIMAPERVAEPDVPTVGEALGVDISHSLSGAIVAPAGIAPEHRERLIEACAAAQEADGFNATLANFNMPAVSQTGDEFVEAITREYEVIGQYIAEHGLGR